MGCNTRAAFSSWVYKNIYKIISIYDSAWRSGVDVSLKLAAAESFRMVPIYMILGKTVFYMLKAGPTLTHLVSQTTQKHQNQTGPPPNTHTPIKNPDNYDNYVMQQRTDCFLIAFWSHDDFAHSDLLAMFHSRAGFWELLSFSADTPPLVPSFSGLSCSHWAVPMLMDWRSIWYWRSSTSEPGSCRMPRLKARL